MNGRKPLPARKLPRRGRFVVFVTREARRALLDLARRWRDLGSPEEREGRRATLGAVASTVILEYRRALTRAGRLRRPIDPRPR